VLLLLLPLQTWEGKHPQCRAPHLLCCIGWPMPPSDCCPCPLAFLCRSWWLPACMMTIPSAPPLIPSWTSWPACWRRSQRRHSTEAPGALRPEARRDNCRLVLREPNGRSSWAHCWAGVCDNSLPLGDCCPAFNRHEAAPPRRGLWRQCWLLNAHNGCPSSCCSACMLNNLYLGPGC